MNYNWQILRPALQKILDEAVESGEECGCELAIYHRGEPVVDLCAGYTGTERVKKVTSATLFPIFSSGKPLLATVAHQLAEREILRYDEPISDFWPEFKRGVKAAITFEHVLSHRGGLPLLPRCTDDDLADWELMARKMAELKPRTPAGAICRYHPLTFAWLLGTPLARATGKSVSQLLHDGIIGPLGLEREFFFGTDAEADTRYAQIDEEVSPEQPSWHRQMMDNLHLRHGCIPSFNGAATARALAKFYAALVWELDGGKRLLRPETLAYATGSTFRAPENPVTQEEWTKFALGFALAGPAGDWPRIFGHGGAAGAEGFFDRERELAVGFVKNRLLPTHPTHPVRDRISEALDLPIRHW